MTSLKVLPKRLSLPKIFDILIAYLNIGADKEYFGVSEVASKSNVTLHNISRNNSFLKNWGFIEESEKEPGKYKLTREAAEFVYAYRINPEGNLTKKILREILSKDEALAKFIERIKRDNLDRESVMLELPKVTGDLRVDKVGLNAFLDLIAYAFEINWPSVPIKPVKKTFMPREAKTIKETIKMAEGKDGGMKPIVPSLSLNLIISPELSPEKLKEYIKAILEAYDEHILSKSK